MSEDICTKARRLLDARTPGEWAKSQNGNGPIEIRSGDYPVADIHWSLKNAEENAELIAAAPGLIEGLLEKCEELERHRKAGEDLIVKYASKWCDGDECECDMCEYNRQTGRKI